MENENWTVLDMVDLGKDIAEVVEMLNGDFTGEYSADRNAG